MTANPATAKNFRFTSDYPMDMIIYLTSGSISVGGFPSSGTTTIPHNLPSTPLINMVWSLTSDFSICYLSGSGPPPQDALRAIPFGVQVDVNADSYNVNINYSNFTDPAITIYYRIYGFEKSTSSNDYAFTASAGDRFVFNTDYNYTKLYQNTVGSPITTNLGYLPQTELFSEDGSGVISPPPTNGLNTLDQTGLVSPIGFLVTTNTITLNTGGLPATLHSRIYLDEAGVL